jgi:hypothetical protein
MKTLTLSIAALLALNTLASAQLATPAQWTPAKDAQSRPPIVTATSSLKLTES